MPKRRSDEDVFRYKGDGKRDSITSGRYLEWRERHKLPYRCENEECPLHAEGALWNGQPIRLIVDHISGICTDDRLENLRLLCPNCNSQLDTHGGGNAGKTKRSSGGFARTREDNKWAYTLPAESGHYVLAGGDAESHSPACND